MALRRYSFKVAVLLACSFFWSQWITFNIATTDNAVNARSHGSETCRAANLSQETKLRSAQHLYSGTSQVKLHGEMMEEIEHLTSKQVQNLVVHPPSKFAFCHMPKNGSSQWLTVLAKLVHNDVSIKTPRFHLARQSREKFGGLAAVKSVLSDPEAFVVVMVRDPLARFASAYLDKCFDSLCKNPFCLVRRDFNLPAGVPCTFRNTLDWFINYVDPTIVDEHWRLQSEINCGLTKILPRYNVIGIMTKSTLSSDAACIMELAGISEFNVLDETRSRGFWKESLNRGKKYSGEDEEEVLKKLFTKEAALGLMQKFQRDYDRFQLPTPSWIESATGEWMDSVDHHKCKERSKLK